MSEEEKKPDQKTEETADGKTAAKKDETAAETTSEKTDQKQNRKEKAKAFWQEYKDAVKDAAAEQKKLYARDNLQEQNQKEEKKSGKEKKGKKPTPQATAASLVMNCLKDKGAVKASKARDVSVFKNLPLSTPTISYTVANLVKQGVIIRTPDDKYYYSEKGYKKLENHFLMGYSAIFIVPILAAIALWLIIKYVVH